MPHRYQWARTALLILAACIVAGCTAKSGVSKELELAPGAPRGYLVGTVGVDRSGPDRAAFATTRVFYRKIGSKGVGSLNGSRDQEFDQTHGEISTEAIAQPLPPGEYEFYGIYGYSSGGYVEFIYNPKVEFSIPFTIRENQVLYVGEWVAHGIWGKNLLGLPTPVAAYFVRSNQAKRDRALIRGKFSELTGLKGRVLKPEQLAPPFLMTPEQADTLRASLDRED